MSTRSSTVVAVTSRYLRFVELVLWILAVATVIVTGSAVVSFAFGDGLLTLKYVLFVVGFLLFGLGSFGIQPKSPRKDEQRVSIEGDGPLDFEERVQELPPLKGEHLPYEDRVSRDAKVFLTSLVVLGISFALEVGLGVGPG